MYLDFDNSVCTCLAKSNMDIMFLLQDCSIPVRSSSDRFFSIQCFFLFMFVYVLIKKTTFVTVLHVY